MPDETAEQLDVIAVGAHPDDVEVACGGTLAQLASQGHRVGIIDLTDGEPTPHSSGVQQRMQEAQAAADVLGLAHRQVLELPNRRLMDGFEARLALAKIFRRHRPNLVIGFGDKTPMASPDHFQAMQITDAAVFYSQLTKWDEHFEDLPPHRIRRQLYFRLAVEPQTLAGNPYHTLVDITEQLDQKLEAARCYQSQFAHKDGILDRIRAAAIATGSVAGVGAAEAFAAARPFATSNVFHSLGLE